MGKYRIKTVKYRDYSIHDEGDIRSIDIIELEPLDQESDICNKDKPKTYFTKEEREQIQKQRGKTQKKYKLVEVSEPKEEMYPCDKCGKLRTKAEGGTIFTVCDECWDKKDEPKEETLEEKFYNHLKSGFLRFYNSEDKEVQKETARRSAKIAKEHFQKKPEEIGVTEYWKEKCAILEEEREKWWSKADKPDDIYFTQDALTGRVSLDKINKIVFQDSKSLFYFNRWWVDKDSIRKALKEMKC